MVPLKLLQSRMNYTFDPEKASGNVVKHGVTFEEAMTVFDDRLSSTLPDDQHSIDELRSITIGMSTQGRLLFVVHADTDSTVRLIGARVATAAERKQYETVA